MWHLGEDSLSYVGDRLWGKRIQFRCIGNVKYLNQSRASLLGVWFHMSLSPVTQLGCRAHWPGVYNLLYVFTASVMF